MLTCEISPTKTAKNLGITFDEDFSFKQHVQNLCKNCYYHIRDFKKIRKHLDISVATGIANALVSSRLDYCNSLFYILTEEYTTKMQRVQNCLARIVTKFPCFSESEPILRKLHWLPIRSRIAFKINVTTYKALNSGLPVYIKEQLDLRKYSVNVRANSKYELRVPLVRGRTGECAFSFAAPHFWNQLPSSVHQSLTIEGFRKQLKIQYFLSPPRYRRSDLKPP